MLALVVNSDCRYPSTFNVQLETRAFHHERRSTARELTNSKTPSIGLHFEVKICAAFSQQTPQLPKMSYSSRPLPSHLRQASTAGNSASTGQSPILLARINEKKAELENLKQLRDLSAGLAGQMQMLEEKLATLSDGTEGRQLNKP